ncbi:exonuclease sbcCD subunit D, partial [Staphylococcus saprophyticus]
SIHHENIEIQKLDDETIIDNFYNSITGEHLTTNQSKKIEKIMTALLEEGSK